MNRSLTSLLMFVALAGVTLAQDRDTKVRDDQRRLADDENWIYDDLEEGMLVAKRENMPLLVILRCIP